MTSDDIDTRIFEMFAVEVLPARDVLARQVRTLVDDVRRVDAEIAFMQYDDSRWAGAYRTAGKVIGGEILAQLEPKANQAMLQALDDIAAIQEGMREMPSRDILREGRDGGMWDELKLAAPSVEHGSIACTALGPYHGDKCNSGRVQAPNAQFTRECSVCGGTGVQPAEPPVVKCRTCGLALYQDAAKVGYCADHEPKLEAEAAKPRPQCGWCDYDPFEFTD